jgi:hypothetical protein
MLAMLNPMMVVSVDAPQVRIVAGDVPTAVSVSDKNAFAIFYSKFSIIIPYITLFVKHYLP